MVVRLTLVSMPSNHQILFLLPHSTHRNYDDWTIQLCEAGLGSGLESIRTWKCNPYIIFLDSYRTDCLLHLSQGLTTTSGIIGTIASSTIRLQLSRVCLIRSVSTIHTNTLICTFSATLPLRLGFNMYNFNSTTTALKSLHLISIVCESSTISGSSISSYPPFNLQSHVGTRSRRPSLE
jgi:hypothetical protein